MNHASLYCKTLDKVTKEELVNALHQALMQFSIMERAKEFGTIEFVDNKPIVAETNRIMAKAGHIGFTN